jgi:hypothetical protein
MRSKQEAARLFDSAAQIDKFQSRSTDYAKQLAYRFAATDCYKAEK